MRILITAGGTREYIDPVRFLSNASTGRMGYALARAALSRANEVTLITAPVALRPPPRATVVQVVSAAEMFAAVKAHFDACDCLIMAAAVSDYTPAKPSRSKIKKDPGERMLRLKPTADILAWAGRNKGSRILVGFALEDRALKEAAQRKMEQKNLDVVVANEPAAIGSDFSTVHVRIGRRDWIELTGQSKAASGKRIITLIEQLAEQRRLMRHS